MKKLIAVLLLLLTVFSLIGCSLERTDGTESSSNSEGEAGTSDPSGSTGTVPHKVGFDESDRLYFAVDGVPVVYERRARGEGRLTTEHLLCRLLLEVEGGQIGWKIYSVKEFPDLEYILAVSATETFTYIVVEDPASEPANPKKSKWIWDLDLSIDKGISSKCFVTIPELDNAKVWFGDYRTVYLNDDVLSEELFGTTGFCTSDLTGDGVPELCFIMALGSGITTYHIKIYDPVTKELLFHLGGGLNFEYSLYLEDGNLCVKEKLKNTQNVIRLGEFKYDGSEIYIEWESPEIEGARIELTYMGDTQHVIPFYEGEKYEFLLNAISAAGGAKGESSKGYYGIPYRLTVYTAEGESYDFCLWSATQYSTSRHTDSEGYQYFFNDDLSKLYKYLDGTFSEDYWYSWIQ